MKCNHDGKAFDSIYGEGKVCYDCALTEQLYGIVPGDLREFSLAQPC